MKGQSALLKVKKHERNKQGKSEIIKRNKKEREVHTRHRPKMVGGGWRDGLDMENLRL